MQATTIGAKLDKRYSPSFRDETTGVPAGAATTSTTTTTARKSSAPKRKLDDVLRLVYIFYHYICLYN